jgi:hypothetical protein
MVALSQGKFLSKFLSELLFKAKNLKIFLLNSIVCEPQFYGVRAYEFPTLVILSMMQG